MFKTIVWATDGSELADSALDFVRELARQDGSKIVAVHANELMRGRFSGYPALADEPELEERIEKQIEELRSVGIDATYEVRRATKKWRRSSARRRSTSTPSDRRRNPWQRRSRRRTHGQRRARPLPYGADAGTGHPAGAEAEREAAKDDQLAAV